jgi:hypothetical protein
MKRFFLIFSFLITFCLSAHSQATGLVDLKFGQAQIADSQWNTGACLYTTTCQIYSKNPGTAYKIPWWSGQLSWAAGDYVKFVTTGDTANPWNAIQYTSAGTQKEVMGTGHIINMGADYFFFVGNDNDTGQLFSMTSGFANTSGVTWTGTLNPTVAQVNTYATNGSTTPLAAGQTAAPPPPSNTTSYTRTNILTFQTWDVQHNMSTGLGQVTTGWAWSCTNCGSTTSGTVQRTVISSDGTVIIVYLLDSSGNLVISEPGGIYTYTGTPPTPAPTAIYMNNATVKIIRAIPTTNNSPGGEGPNSAFDNNPNTKYLNFDKKNAGVTVQLNTGRAVTGFTVTTANDFSGRDPTSYKLSKILYSSSVK